MKQGMCVEHVVFLKESGPLASSIVFAFVCVNEKDDLFIVIGPVVELLREILKDLTPGAGCVVVKSQMADLLKVSSIACASFCLQRGTRAVGADNIYNDVFFAFNSKMTPASHS